MVDEYKHWSGVCQIKVYLMRHHQIQLDWQNCPYNCSYANEMREWKNTQTDRERDK